MVDEMIHRCPKKCQWNKRCFVCKTKGPITEDVVVLHRCKITKEDIPVHLGKIKNTLCSN